MPIPHATCPPTCPWPWPSGRLHLPIRTLPLQGKSHPVGRLSFRWIPPWCRRPGLTPRLLSTGHKVAGVDGFDAIDPAHCQRFYSSVYQSAGLPAFPGPPPPNTQFQHRLTTSLPSHITHRKHTVHGVILTTHCCPLLFNPGKFLWSALHCPIMSCVSHMCCVELS